MEEFKIPVTAKAVKHGFEVGKKVYLDKLSFPDKWHMGGANEIQADVYGFIAETVVCEFFKQPFPELTKGKNDAFDMLLDGRRIDIKKVGYSRLNKRTKITLNKKQFLRKKHLIDSFLFCTFNGAFNQKAVQVIEKGEIKNYTIYLPTPNLSKLWLIGWIETEDVEKKSKIYIWKDQEGNPRDESFQLYEKNLKSVKELIK